MLPNEMNKDLSDEQPDRDTYIKYAITSETLGGFVSMLFPPRSFTYADGDSSFVQNCIVLDVSAKRHGCSTWNFKITTWNIQAANLSVRPNKTYCFTHCKLKSAPRLEKTLRVKPILMCIFISIFDCCGTRPC